MVKFETGELYLIDNYDIKILFMKLKMKNKICVIFSW